MRNEATHDRGRNGLAQAELSVRESSERMCICATYLNSRVADSARSSVADRILLLQNRVERGRAKRRAWLSHDPHGSPALKETKHE